MIRRGAFFRAFSGAFLGAIALAACATAPEPAIRTVEVKVPVAVKCATPLPPAQPYADTPEAIRAAADLYRRVQLLLAGRDQRDARIAEAEASAAGCRP